MRRFQRQEFDPTGNIEIVGASFLADEPAIISKPNTKYHERELAWYLSMSRHVQDFPPPVPAIWQEIASEHGYVNSNYGYLMYSWQNGAQFENVVNTLKDSPHGRRATAIYTRPSMHVDWNQNGMRDFVCTNAVNYLIRDRQLHVTVQMRSNDAVFGYPNDLEWQKFVQNEICSRLTSVTAGPIVWQASSLHVYPRHFKYLQQILDRLGPS